MTRPCAPGWPRRPGARGGGLRRAGGVLEGFRATGTWRMGEELYSTPAA
ncbi:hypothetical protein [Streptosporangium vulgare]